MRARMRSRTRDEWLAHFADADVCLTTVSTPDEARNDPHLATRAAAVQEGESEPAPALGASTDAVLEAAGFDAAARGRLRASGVI